MTAAAASAIFDRPRRDTTVTRDRAVFTAAASLERFTIDDVALKAGGGRHKLGDFYSPSQRILRLLWMEGHLKLVDGNTKPLVYQWVES